MSRACSSVGMQDRRTVTTYVSKDLLWAAGPGRATGDISLQHRVSSSPPGTQVAAHWGLCVLLSGSWTDQDLCDSNSRTLGRWRGPTRFTGTVIHRRTAGTKCCWLISRMIITKSPQFFYWHDKIIGRSFSSLLMAAGMDIGISLKV